MHCDRKFRLLGAALTIAYSVAVASPTHAHDMSAMGSMDAHDPTAAPNAMGSQMTMDAHMVMTSSRAESPNDLERAHDTLDTLRRVLARYRDSHVALALGYKIFLPTVPQEVYHFTDYSAAQLEYTGRFNPARPGSLLYVKKPDGDYVLVGAMYSAPPDYTEDQLDQLIPLSVAHWHSHVNICLPNGITLNDMLRGEIGAEQDDLPGMMPVTVSPSAHGINERLGFMADGRFGFTGKISDPAQCGSAGGHFIPKAFGWMVHVYPFSGDDLKVAFGTSVPKIAN